MKGDGLTRKKKVIEAKIVLEKQMKVQETFGLIKSSLKYKLSWK
jgi:hypothetical protein